MGNKKLECRRIWQFDKDNDSVYDGDSIDRTGAKISIMATIKKISEKSGYSPSTVSIVLRGIGAERNISDSTQKKVMDAARELGYQPNVSARRLRSDEPEKRNIAVFWAADFRAVMVAKFLQGFQRFILENKLDMEVLICPYQPNCLEESATHRTLNMYSGALICTASEKDLEYVEQLNTSCPIVLYNRRSERFPSVGVDNEKIGQCIAEKFIKDGCSKAAIVADHRELSYSRIRVRGCVERLKKEEIEVKEIFAENNSIAEGKKCVSSLSLGEGKTGIFAVSDYLAFGILNELTEIGVKIPEQAELISIGTNEEELYGCFRPSLSVIEIPIEEMAYHCAKVLNHIIETRTQDMVKIKVPFHARFMQSTLPE